MSYAFGVAIFVIGQIISVVGSNLMDKGWLSATVFVVGQIIAWTVIIKGNDFK